MANDAFALSPISASGSLPSEADYEAISEAFMETARGRWFLKEYARRNRNSDTAMVLDAVSRIETAISAQRQAAAATMAQAASESAEKLAAATAEGAATVLQAIRATVDEARAGVAAALDLFGRDETFAPSRRGVRIIREVAWRLREVGYDGRICDILESQADAIGANHDAILTQDTHAAVLASFDMIARRLDDLAESAYPSSPAGPRASSASGPTDLAAARLARERAFATDDFVSKPDDTGSLAIEPAAGETTSSSDAPADTVGTEAADVMASALMASDQAVQPHAVSEDALTAAAASRALLQVHPSLQHTVPSRAPTSATQSVAENVVNLVTAKPVAQPIAAPVEDAAPPVGTTDTSRADEQLELTQAAIAVAMVELNDSDLGEPDLVAPELSQPDTVAPDLAARSDITSAVAPQELLADPAASAPAAMSLGHSLLASGTISISGATNKSDPIAPIRRMSQAEKIAFFS